MARHTLSPAYGRDYKSKAKVLIDWNGEKDFLIEDFSSEWCGKPANRQQFKPGDVINIRYQNMTKVMVINM